MSGVIKLVAGLAYAMILVVGAASPAASGQAPRTTGCAWFDTCTVDTSSVDLRY